MDNKDTFEELLELIKNKDTKGFSKAINSAKLSGSKVKDLVSNCAEYDASGCFHILIDNIKGPYENSTILIHGLNLFIAKDNAEVLKKYIDFFKDKPVNLSNMFMLANKSEANKCLDLILEYSDSSACCTNFLYTITEDHKLNPTRDRLIEKINPEMISGVISSIIYNIETNYHDEKTLKTIVLNLDNLIANLSDDIFPTMIKVHRKDINKLPLEATKARKMNEEIQKQISSIPAVARKVDLDKKIKI